MKKLPCHHKLESTKCVKGQRQHTTSNNVKSKRTSRRPLLSPPVPSAHVSAAVQQAITAPLPTNQHLLHAIVHGDPLPFSVTTAIPPVVVPPPPVSTAAATALADGQTQRDPRCERMLMEKYGHPSSKCCHRSSRSQRSTTKGPHRERSLFEETQTIKSRFVFVCFFHFSHFHNFEKTSSLICFLSLSISDRSVTAKSSVSSFYEGSDSAFNTPTR